MHLGLTQWVRYVFFFPLVRVQPSWSCLPGHVSKVETLEMLDGLKFTCSRLEATCSIPASCHDSPQSCHLPGPPQAALVWKLGSRAVPGRVDEAEKAAFGGWVLHLSWGDGQRRRSCRERRPAWTIQTFNRTTRPVTYKALIVFGFPVITL